MNRAFVELLLILALVVAAGTVYNFASRENPKKFLPWIAPRRPTPCFAQKGTLPDQKVVEKNGGTKEESKPQGGDTHPSESGPFRFIDHAETLSHYQDGVTLFVDARRTAEYEAGHITGAICISPWEADYERKISQLRQNPETNPEVPIVVYCTSSKDCTDSLDLAGFLSNAGFKNIVIYRGGFPQWQKEVPQLVTTGSEPGVKQ